MSDLNTNDEEEMLTVFQKQEKELKKGRTKQTYDEASRYLDAALLAYGQNPDAYNEDISNSVSVLNGLKSLEIIEKKYYRIAITCPVSFSGDERQEMRSFPLDCMDFENYQKWVKHLKSVIEEEKEKTITLDHHFLFDSVKKYYDFFEVFFHFLT
jgi:hypothetical protein